ncbi:ECF transporter S component [Dethiothermospora halolimnae]|uniref:ECF transporter S component n=1 Tax=Dethiothermospora halolimnae TaxID=3114390 RepID=UPI003CCBD352
MKKISTREFVLMGLLIAISVLLDVLPIGTLRLPVINATIAHIPTIIGGIVLGPYVGGIVGLFFGLSSLLRNLTQPTSVLAFAFINPLVSVVPRVLVGIISYYVYVAIKRLLNENLGIIIGAALGSITNTIGVMGMIYILYAQDIVEKMDSSQTAKGIVLGIITAHGIPEMIVAGVITVIIVKALKKVYKFNGANTYNN